MFLPLYWYVNRVAVGTPHPSRFSHSHTDGKLSGCLIRTTGDWWACCVLCASSSLSLQALWLVWGKLLAWNIYHLCFVVNRLQGLCNARCKPWSTLTVEFCFEFKTPPGSCSYLTINWGFIPLSSSSYPGNASLLALLMNRWTIFLCTSSLSECTFCLIFVTQLSSALGII